MVLRCHITNSRQPPTGSSRTRRLQLERWLFTSGLPGGTASLDDDCFMDQRCCTTMVFGVTIHVLFSLSFMSFMDCLAFSLWLWRFGGWLCWFAWLSDDLWLVFLSWKHTSREASVVYHKLGVGGWQPKHNHRLVHRFTIQQKRCQDGKSAGNYRGKYRFTILNYYNYIYDL